MRKTIIAGMLLILASAAPTSELPVADPEAVGFSGERLKNINRFTQRFIEEGKQTGFVTIVARHGKIVHFEASGKYGVDNEKAMDKDALFRIYSMTKPVTNVAAMILYEDGEFQLNDPVAQFLPEFAGQTIWLDGELVEPDSPITVEQLMTHTAGFTNGYSGDHPVEELYRDAKLDESVDSNEF
ncbi:MAG: beta-lactamase family protein, partial [Gammaproteobacteria bacterium]|nr:beta-lactamase family protein [Gammaproteobacteria bacterium]